MNSAFAAALACPYPAPGPFIGADGDLRARRAAQRSVPFVVKRIDLHMIQRHLLPYLALVPDKDRVELDKAGIALLDFLEIGARASLGASKAGHPA